MPHKMSSWLIIIVGMGITVYVMGFLIGLKESLSLNDTYSQLSLVAALVFFVVGTVATGRLTKWWDKK
jgi:hypothetical protein